MKNSKWSIPAILLVVMLASPVLGQPPKAKKIEVATHVGQTALWVGDAFPYRIRIIHDHDVEFVLDNITQEKLSLPPFVVRRILLRQKEWAENKKMLELTFTLVTYETGKNIIEIPALSLYYFDRSGRDRNRDPVAQAVQIPATKIGLRSTLTGGPLEPRDSRPLATVNRNRAWTFLLLGIAGFTFAGAQSIRMFWGKFHKKKSRTRRITRREREMWAQSNLERIRSLALGTPEEVNEFYAELSLFLREYLGYWLQIDALALTPEEVETELAKAKVSPPGAEQIRNVLSHCDAIRYGKDGMREGLSSREQTLGIVEKIIAQ